jgi:hypothetical protein
MLRSQLIEQIIRQVYGNQPTDDASITPNLVNQFVNEGVGLAVKQNYRDSIQLDGVGYINNSFYLTFKGITISQDENFLWKIDLPQIPYGIGKNEGVSALRFKNSSKEISLPVIWLTQDQVNYYQSMPIVPNKTLAYYQSSSIYVISTIALNLYTATVTMVSGGDSTNLSSKLNVPDDYIPIIVDYAVKALMMARAQVKETANDGESE